MRPASVIFLVISVVIIAAGLGLCFMAQNKAEDAGIKLFDTEVAEDGDIVETVEFENIDIGRIVLNLTECDVNIVKSDRTHVELINFAAGTYSQSTSNQTYTLDNKLSIMSLFNFADSGFEFNGIRQYLQYYNTSKFKDKPKTVNIYIAHDEAIKIFEIDVDKGDVNLSGISKKANYTVNVGSGNVNIDNVSTSDTMAITIKEGDAVISARSISTCNVEIEKGSLDLTVISPDMQTYDLAIATGRIVYVGNDKGSTYAIESPMASMTISAKIGQGRIEVKEMKLNNAADK